MNNNPYLPQNAVKTVLIGALYVNQIIDLTKLGISTIKLPKNNKLDDEISYHSDMMAFNCGNNNIIINAELKGELIEKLNTLNFNIIKGEQIFSPYPNDIKLNAAYIDNKILCNERFCDKNLLEFCNKNGIIIKDIKQGYAKCSTCLVSEKAVITEDDGIAKLLNNYQFDVLKIDKGYVKLSPKHYGFIGGASSKISKDELYFTGNIENHPNYKEIKRFLDKHKVKPIYNKNNDLLDIGGIIPLN